MTAAVLARVADVLDLDRSSVAQRVLEAGYSHSTHQWVRDGFQPFPSVVPEQATFHGVSAGCG